MRALLLILALTALPAHATLKIVTTLPDLADFTRQVGGTRVTVDVIVRGDQNPHFIDVKPSYMMKLRSADVFFMIGMDLELWAQQIIDGSRTASLTVVDLSRAITKLEVPVRTDASQGDVHRYGNPHYWLDPRNVRTIVGEIVEALSQKSPEDESEFRANAESYLKQLDDRITAWEATMKPLAGSRLITFHNSWVYFAAWLHLSVEGQVEPKPGVSPTPSHTAELIRLVRDRGIRCILVEPFYDTGAAEQIARSTGARVLRLPTSVGGAPEARDYISLMDYNVNALAAALR